MGKVGKISTIKREYNSSQLQTLQSGLAAKGMTRIPGQEYLSILTKN